MYTNARCNPHHGPEYTIIERDNFCMLFGLDYYLSVLGSAACRPYASPPGGNPIHGPITPFPAPDRGNDALKVCDIPVRPQIFHCSFTAVVSAQPQREREKNSSVKRRKKEKRDLGSLVGVTVLTPFSEASAGEIVEPVGDIPARFLYVVEAATEIVVVAECKVLPGCAARARCSGDRARFLSLREIVSVPAYVRGPLPELEGGTIDADCRDGEEGCKELSG